MFQYLWDRAVIKAVWPVFLGYLPLGFAGGVLAQKVGLSIVETGLMSLLVFAGSGQFIALAMIGSGASIASIVLTTFIVNLRHTLYSSTLATYIMGRSKKYIGVFAQGITDETFAINMSNFAVNEWSPQQALALNILAHSGWIFSNMVGNAAGSVIAVDMDVVSYSLTAMFIALWSYHFGNKLLILTGLFSGVIALGLSGFLSNKLHIVAATVIAATIACIIEGGAKKYD